MTEDRLGVNVRTAILDDTDPDVDGVSRRGSGQG